MAAGPWKFDVTLLDLMGYSSDSARLYLAPDDRLVVSIGSSSETGLYDDFYVQELRTTELQSTDGGISWKACEGQMPPSGVRAVDGTWVCVGNETLEGEALGEHLGREGLGHLYRPGAQMGHRLYRAEKRAELEAQGYYVYDAFKGLVATLPEIVTFISKDAGKTWTRRRIDNAPRFAWICGWHGGRGIVLADGTLLGAIYGRLNRTDPAQRVWVTRSTDHGLTWEFIPLFYDLDQQVGFDETCLIVLPSGRILAMSRPEFPDRHNMWQSFSDDGGQSWSAAHQVPFWGFPPHLIAFNNGDVMVTYAHRRHPCGVRACVSHDEGQTWDIENEKIIKDDSLPKGVGYPESAQLSDSSLFTTYAMSKIAGLKPEDQVQYGRTLVLHPWFHTFVGGSRYSLDFVGARGQQRVCPAGVFPRRSTPEIGTDAVKTSPQR